MAGPDATIDPDARGAMGDTEVARSADRAVDAVVSPPSEAGEVDALAVVRDPDAQPEPALATEVHGDDLWAEAGRTVLRVQLGRMLARVPGVLEGTDPEHVHATRVAARRMRAAWRVFGDAYERGARRQYITDLRAVGRRLGAVRDLDVLIDILSRYAARCSRRERTNLQPLLHGWAAERAARHADLVIELESAAFETFVTEYLELVQTPGAVVRPQAPGPAHVRDRMPSRIWAAYEVVWAYEEKIGDADIATLHALRIAGKWLRYTIEFAREPLRPESPTLIAPVVALQDHIGDLHDHHVAAVEATRWLQAQADLDTRAHAAAVRFVAAMEHRAGRQRTRVGRPFEPIVSSEYRRRLGRALARL